MSWARGSARGPNAGICVVAKRRFLCHGVGTQPGKDADSDARRAQKNSVSSAVAWVRRCPSVHARATPRVRTYYSINMYLYMLLLSSVSEEKP